MPSSKTERQRYLFSSLLLSCRLEVLTNTIQKENAMESIQLGNEQKLSIYRNNSICKENLKSTKKEVTRTNK